MPNSLSELTAAIKEALSQHNNAFEQSQSIECEIDNFSLEIQVNGRSVIISAELPGNATDAEIERALSLGAASIHYFKGSIAFNQDTNKLVLTDSIEHANVDSAMSAVEDIVNQLDVWNTMITTEKKQPIQSTQGESFSHAMRV